MNDKVQVQFGTRHLLWLTTAICILLGIPGLLWILFPFAAVTFFVGFGAAAIVIGTVLVYFFVLLVPPLRRRLFDQPNRFENEVVLHKALRASRENDA